MPIDLLVIPLEGCQVVLGAQWMKELGDVSFNFSKLQIKSQFQGQIYIWQGINDNHKLMKDKDIPKESTKGQLTLLMYSKELQVPTNSCLQQTIHPDVQAILQQYPSVTNSTPSLPPTRSCDHKIPLLPNAKPVCLRPYRHSFHIKK